MNLRVFLPRGKGPAGCDPQSRSFRDATKRLRKLAINHRLARDAGGYTYGKDSHTRNSIIVVMVVVGTNVIVVSISRIVIVAVVFYGKRYPRASVRTG